MDSKAVLLEADARTHLGEYDTALILLQRYYDMRLNGECQPIMEPAFQTGGDDFSRMLMTRINRRLRECKKLSH